MLDISLTLKNHFSILGYDGLSYEDKVAEYSQIESIISDIPKDELKRTLVGLSSVGGLILRDMATESIIVVKHTLSIMSDFLSNGVEVFKNKQEVIRQLILLIQKNAPLSHNIDIICSAIRCISLLCESECIVGSEAVALKAILVQCIASTLKKEEPLKIQSLLFLKLMLQMKLWDCKDNTNNWLKLFTNCLFDDNPDIRGAALSIFNIFKNYLTGKEDHIDKLCANLIPLKYSKFLIELVAIDKDWAQIWRLLVELMGKRLHSSSVLVNSLLAVEEKAFKTSNIETKKEAFICWKSLIHNFSLEHGVLASERRVKLITIPLRANNCRNMEIAHVKLDVWWYVLRLLRSDVAPFQDIVLLPFLKFCFGPFGDTSLLSTNGQNRLSGSNNGEGLGRQYLALHVPCLHALTELLSKSAGIPLPQAMSEELVLSPLFEPPLVKQKDFCHSSRILTQCIGEAVLLIGHDMEQLPWITHAWRSLLILVNRGTGETVNFTFNDSNTKDLKCVAMVKDVLRLLVNLVETIATVPEAKAVGHVVLTMVECLVVGDASLHISVLNSHVYAVGSTQVMNGTPTLLLARLLLSSAVLNDKTSSTRYMSVFSKLLVLGLNDMAHPLPFVRALLKKLEAHVSSEQLSLANMTFMQEIWILIVDHLADVIDKGGAISEGNDAVHDFQCIYGLLMLPISHFLKNDSKKEFIDPALKPWKRMFGLFFINSQLVITIQSFEVIEELCKKIAAVIKKINATLSFIANLIPFVLIIYNVEFYESYWKVSKTSWDNSVKGEKSKGFYNSQHLLILLFYKIMECMPLSYDESESVDKHLSIISFFNLMYSIATQYNFLNFLFEKGIVCVGYYLKLTSEHLKYQMSLEKEMIKLWEKFLEYAEKKVFVPKGKMQALLDILSPLLVDGFKHPIIKIAEITKSYWIRSLGQICVNVIIPKSLSDILDDALKDLSNSEDITREIEGLEKAVPLKFPNILKKANENEISPKRLADAKQIVPSTEKDVDFKVIPPRKKAPILTEHQKEMLRVRRVDIPALYQDLTQDSASQFFSPETTSSAVLNPAPSSVAPEITEDANLPFLNDNESSEKEVSTIIDEVQIMKLNIPTSKTTDKSFQAPLRPDEEKNSNDTQSALKTNDVKSVVLPLSPKNSDQQSPNLLSKLDDMINTRKRRQKSKVVSPAAKEDYKSKLAPDSETAFPSVSLEPYSSSPISNRSSNKNKSNENIVASEASGKDLISRGDDVMKLNNLGGEPGLISPTGSKEGSVSMSKKNYSKVLGVRSDITATANCESKISGSISSSSTEAASAPHKSDTDVIASSKLPSPDILATKSPVTTSSGLANPSPIQLKTTEAPELVDPSNVISRSTLEAASTSQTLLLLKASDIAEASSSQTLVPHKSVGSAEAPSPSTNPDHMPQKSNVESDSSDTFKHVLRKSLTNRLSNLRQTKKPQLQDSAKENEIPAVSQDLGPKKRGRPKRVNNLGSVDVNSPSTSNNKGRNNRKSVDAESLDSVLGATAESFEDIGSEKEVYCHKEQETNIGVDHIPCSNETTLNCEKLSAVEKKEQSKGTVSLESELSSDEVDVNHGNSSNEKEMRCERTKIVGIESSPNHLVNVNVSSSDSPAKCSSEREKSFAVNSPKANTVIGSPKTKQSSASPKSKSGLSPNLDKWVIVTKRENAEKSPKKVNEARKENKAEEIKVPSFDSAKDASNITEVGNYTEKFFSNSEDLIDSSQDPLDCSNSSFKSMTRKCTVNLSRMAEVFSDEVTFIPFEGKIVKCNLSPSKKDESKSDCEPKRSALPNSVSSVATNLFLSPYNTGRGARILNLAQGHKERDTLEESSGSPLKEVDTRQIQLSSNSNLQGSPLSHLRLPEYGNSTPMKKPRRIRPMQIGNVSPQYCSLEIGCVVSDGDITIHSYSPNASPRGSLMKKRKSTQESGEDSISPASKKARRVSFADPIVSKHVEFCIPESERKFKKCGVSRCLKMPYGPPDEELSPDGAVLCPVGNEVLESSTNKATSEGTEAPPMLSSDKTEDTISKDTLKIGLSSSAVEEEKPLEDDDVVIISEKSCASKSINKQDVSQLLSLVNCTGSGFEKLHLERSQINPVDASDIKDNMSCENVSLSNQDNQEEESCLIISPNPTLDEPMETDQPIMKSPSRKENCESRLPLDREKNHGSEKAALSPISDTPSNELSSQNLSEDNPLEPCTDRLDSEKEACPALRDCTEPLNDDVLCKLTSRIWRERCKSVLDKRGIKTMGDLSRLTEELVEGIPFKMEKWKTLKAELNAYKLKLDKRKEILAEKEQTDYNLKMKIFREMLPKLSVKEVVKELNFFNMTEDVIREMGNNNQNSHAYKSSAVKDDSALGQCSRVETLPSFNSVVSQVSRDELCSMLKPLDMLQSLIGRSDVIGELSLEKMMGLLKCVVTATCEKEVLSGGLANTAARSILQCVLSGLMGESGSANIVEQLLWLFQNTFLPDEYGKCISALLNGRDACVVSELILNEENIMKSMQNQINPSKALKIAIGSLSRGGVSSLPLEDLNRLSDLIDDNRSTEELLDRMLSKIKQRLSNTRSAP